MNETEIHKLVAEVTELKKRVAELEASRIQRSQFLPNTIEGRHLAEGTVSATELADDSVTPAAIGTGVFLDEDNMASDSALVGATQQSIKYYADHQTTFYDSADKETLVLVGAANAAQRIQITNAAAGSNPIIEPTGFDSNIHLIARAKGSALLKTSVLRQDTGTDAYKHNSVVLTGWGTMDVSSVQENTEAVTFGITFAAAPVVVCSSLSADDAASTAIGDLIYGPDNLNLTWTVDARSVATTGFTVGARASGAWGANTHIGYSWIAVGEL